MPELIRARGGDGRYVIALPGSWTIVPLESNRAMTAAVSALVKEYLGRDDRRAGLRRELHERFLGMAREACDGGIEFLALAPELVTGVPFGGALTARTIAWPADAEPLTTAARTVGSADREFAGHVERMIAVDYVVPSTGSDTTALVLAFSVPAATVPVDALLPLFDTIVEAVAWV